MASVNKVILIGNLGRDPEVRYTASGDPVANFSLATTEQWKDKSGEKMERVEWHRVTCWGKLAEIVGEHLVKGSQVYVEGSIRTQKFTDKEGKDRESKDINADQIRFLGKPPGGERGEQRSTSKPAAQSKGGGDKAADSFEEDIPFIRNECTTEATPSLERRLARARR